MTRAGNGSSALGSGLSLPTCVISFLTSPTHPPSFLTYKVATIVSVISLAIIVWVVGSHTFIECLLGAMQLETVYLVGQKNELSQNT